ncbi:MAG: 2-C-methyl-D-erythritol 2,4-cyclodiphosphate synthase [Gemmatimonadota bacterium]
MRVGIGYDSHRFGTEGPLVLGGVRIPECAALTGHSDGDAVVHALIDALLGAAGLGDIGVRFPDSDPALQGADSILLLAQVVRLLAREELEIRNVDVTVVAEAPRLAPHREAMRERLAATLGVSPSAVSLKGKSNEGMGWIGRGEGIAVHAVALLGPAGTASRSMRE